MLEGSHPPPCSGTLWRVAFAMSLMMDRLCLCHGYSRPIVYAYVIAKPQAKPKAYGMAVPRA